MASTKTKDPKGGQSKKKLEELFFSGSDDELSPEIECDLCSKKFSSVSMYEQHLNSKKHYQMLTKQKMKQKVGDLQREDGVDIDSENVDDGDLDEELHCDVCQKSFSGYIPFAAHIKGSFHGKKVKQLKLKESLKDMPEVLGEKDLENLDDDAMQKPYARCTACGKDFYDPRALKQHLAGTSHRNNLKKMELTEKLKSELSGDSLAGDDDEEFFSKCTVCNKSFSGPVPYKVHLHSSVHLKEVKKVQAAEDLKAFFVKDSTGQLICNECQKAFPDAMALKSHLENNSHGKRKIKDEMFEFVSSNPEIVAVKAVQNISSEEENEESFDYKNGHYFLVCKLCHSSFSGPESAKDHVQSKKHVKAKREKAERKVLKEKLKDKSKEQDLANNSLKHKENGLTADDTVDAAISASAKNNSKTEASDEFEFV